MKPKFLTVDEYAKLMKVSECSVRRMCQRGDIRAIKSGNQWRIPVEVKDSIDPDAMRVIVDGFAEIGGILERISDKLRQCGVA